MCASSFTFSGTIHRVIDCPSRHFFIDIIMSRTANAKGGIGFPEVNNRQKSDSKQNKSSDCYPAPARCIGQQTIGYWIPEGRNHFLSESSPEAAILAISSGAMDMGGVLQLLGILAR